MVAVTRGLIIMEVVVVNSKDGMAAFFPSFLPFLVIVVTMIGAMAGCSRRMDLYFMTTNRKDLRPLQRVYQVVIVGTNDGDKSDMLAKVVWRRQKKGTCGKRENTDDGKKTAAWRMRLQKGCFGLSAKVTTNPVSNG
jgi:hypothetical protein